MRLCLREFNRVLIGRGVLACNQAEGRGFMGESPEAVERLRPEAAVWGMGQTVRCLGSSGSGVTYLARGGFRAWHAKGNFQPGAEADLQRVPKRA